MVVPRRSLGRGARTHEVFSSTSIVVTSDAGIDKRGESGGSTHSSSIGPHARDARVVVGDFGAVGAAGLVAMLEAEGIAVAATGLDTRELVAKVDAGEADVVIVDRQASQSEPAAERIAAERPDVRVIACSLDETTMLVYPSNGGPPHVAPLDPPRLASAVRERA
jgi:hypothetical protein